MVLRPPIARGLRFSHRCCWWTERDKSSNQANQIFHEIWVFRGAKTPVVVAKATDADAAETTLPREPEEAREPTADASRRAAVLVSRAALSSLFGAARRGCGRACSDQSTRRR